MIGYKDKTFCSFYKKCIDGKTCDRALTDEVWEKAKKWWGNDDPPVVDFKFYPKCFKERRR